MSKLLMTAIAAALLVSGGAASADPKHDNNGHNDKGRGHENSQQANHGNDKADHRQDQWERQAQKRYSAGKYRTPKGYQSRQWAHGERLPANYRTRSYVVDYRQYGLPAPPRGYQYVRVGNDAYLSGSNTGVVEAVIRALFQ